MLTQENFSELLEGGLSYRYSKERWNQLQNGNGAMPFKSPWRKVKVNGRQMVEELIQPILQPVYLTEEEQAFFERLAASWHEVMQGLFQVIARDSRCGKMARAVFDTMCFTRACAKTGYPDYPTPFLRLDMVRDENGQFKTVDINTTRPAGLGDCMVLASVFAKLGMGTQYPFGKAFENVVRQCFAQWSQTYAIGTKARIAIVNDEQAGDWHNFRILSEVLSTQPWVEKVHMISSAPKPESQEYNLIIRGRIKQGHPEYDALCRLPVSQYCIISPLGYRWLGSKYWFVYLFNQNLRKALKPYVSQLALETVCNSLPQTGILTSRGTVEFNNHIEDTATLSRADWLIKPPAGSSGKGILMGRSMSQTKWETALRDSQNYGALMQRYYRRKENFMVLNSNGNAEPKDLYVKYGAFLYGGDLAGIEVMARNEPLVHGARNTYFTVCAKQ